MITYKSVRADMDPDRHFKETCREAVREYSQASQIDMAIEECGELIVALMHWKRGRAEATAIETEIADVEIMLEQLRCIFNPVEIGYQVRGKIKRLAARIEASRERRAKDGHGR